jgi:hypothetical protein
MKTLFNQYNREGYTTTAQPVMDKSGLNKVMSRFDPVGLDEMDAQKLQNRIDTKFLFDAALLPEILTDVCSDYSALYINGTNIQPYLSLYFDTLSYENYFAHHNGKRPRFKIRMRKYLNGGEAFLEIKEKDNKNRTIKKRMEITDITAKLSPEHYQYISEIYSLGLVPLKPVIWNRYNRLTLVNKNSLERVTIDLNYNAFNQNGFISWNEFVIAEIKQGERSPNTKFYQAMKSRYIKPVNFSKYCISMALLTPQLKSNKFKMNIETIKTYLQRSFKYAF